MAKGGQTYDFSFLRTNGADVGFMLDEVNGKKKYERFTDPTLAQQFFTGSPDLGRMEPEKQFSINQSNYKGGYGLEFASDSGIDSYRYYESLGVDARFKNNLICGPVATGIALPSDPSPSMTDGGLEAWDTGSVLTNYTFVQDSSTPTLALNGPNKRSGTYCAKISSAGGGARSGHFYQDVNWESAYQGRGFTFTAWVKASTANDARIEIHDGVGESLSSYHTGGGNYEQLTVTRILDGSATRLRLKCQLESASGVDVYFDDLAVSLASGNAIGNPVAFADFNNELYIGAGGVLLKLNGAGNGFTAVSSFLSPITDLEAFTDGNLYICLGSTASEYYYMNTSEALTQSTEADGFAEYMTNVSGVMYKAVLPNQLKKATDPTNAGSWGSAITVGSTFTDITDLISEVDVPYIGKEDMPYYLDGSDNDLPLIQDVQSLLKSTNCKNMIAWHRKIYVPVGESGLAEYDDGTISWRSPARFMTNLSNFNGQVQALAGDEEYIFAVVDNGAKLEILAGQATDVEGTATWVWHNLKEITLTGAETAFVSSIYKKRLWIASTSVSDSVFYIPLTTMYGDITSDTDYEFQTGGTLVTPWYHINLKADSKAYFSLTVDGEGLDSNNYITVDRQVYYTALTGAWTNLGNFTTSPSQTRYFPTSGTVASGRMIRFRFTVVTNSTSTTPKMTNFDCRGIWRPTKRKLIACVVKLGDNILPKKGRPRDTYTAMKEALDEAYDKVWPNTFYDIDSTNAQGTQTAKYCNLLYAREYEVVLIEGEQPESKYELLFEEVTLS